MSRLFGRGVMPNECSFSAAGAPSAWFAAGQCPGDPGAPGARQHLGTAAVASREDDWLAAVLVLPDVSDRRLLFRRPQPPPRRGDRRVAAALPAPRHDPLHHHRRLRRGPRLGLLPRPGELRETPPAQPGRATPRLPAVCHYRRLSGRRNHRPAKPSIALGPDRLAGLVPGYPGLDFADRRRPVGDRHADPISDLSQRLRRPPRPVAQLAIHPDGGDRLLFRRAVVNVSGFFGSACAAPFDGEVIFLVLLYDRKDYRQR